MTTDPKIQALLKTFFENPVLAETVKEFMLPTFNRKDLPAVNDPNLSDVVRAKLAAYDIIEDAFSRMRKAAQTSPQRSNVNQSR